MYYTSEYCCSVSLLYEFPGLAITKYHKLGSLKQQNVFSSGSGDQKCEIQVFDRATFSL